MKPLPLAWIIGVYLALGASVIHDFNGNIWTFPLVFVLVFPFFWNTYLVFTRKERNDTS